MIIEYLFVAAIIGMIVGSFLNMLATRIPLKLEQTWYKDCKNFLLDKNIEIPEANKIDILGKQRSSCPKCSNTIKWHDNIPLLSYLFLRGRCRKCASKIPLRYFLLELSAVAVTIHLVIYYGLSYELILPSIFIWSLLLLSTIDFEHQILPDEITFTMLWIGLLTNLHFSSSPIALYIYGAVFGYTVLWFVSVSFEYFTSREGMGLGDAKLLAMLGAWCGVDMILPIILVSSIFALMVQGVNTIFFATDKRLPFAYGPYLAGAGWIAFFYGNDLLNIYLKFSLGV